MIAPDAADVFEDPPRRIVVVLDGARMRQIDFLGVDGRMLLRLVTHQEPHHRQRQNERKDAQRIELSAPAEVHDQRGDQEAGEHRPDHGADPPIGRRLAALAQRKPIGDQRKRHRIAGGLADAQADARGEQHAVACRQAGPETGRGPDDEARHDGIARAEAGHRPAPHRRREAIGDEHARSQPAEQLGLAGKLHFVQKFWISHDKRDVALVEHRDDPIDQERRRDIGPAHAGRSRNAGGVARKPLRNRDGHPILPLKRRAVLLVMGRRRTMPAPFEVARFRRQNVARAPGLVNNTSHAGAMRLGGTCGCAQW